MCTSPARPLWLLISLAACNGDPSATDDKDTDLPPADTDVAADTDVSDTDIAPTGPEIVTCATLAAGPCVVVAGEPTSGGDHTLLVGTVLAPDTLYRGGAVLLDASGTITCVGCDCDATAAGATTITCPTGVISPGLIDAAQHVTYGQNSPATDLGERYEDRQQWRTGADDREEVVASGGASSDQVRWTELRALMAGTTSMVGAGSSAGLVRNLDRTADLEGLATTAVAYKSFPLGDSNGARLSATCAYPDIVTPDDLTSVDAAFLQVGEGVDAFAANEFGCLSGAAAGGQDIVSAASTLVHGVALTAADLRVMAEEGAGLVWSPRSNLRLYGDTAKVTVAARLGVPVALGTDWTTTGSVNLLRELRCADSFDEVYLDDALTDQALWRMATAGGARVTATAGAIGGLTPGLAGDLVIFEGAAHPDFRAVIDAEPQDVRLVLRSGKPLYGDAAVLTALSAPSCDTLDVCGVDKQVCLSDEIGKTLSQLQASIDLIYPAFFCGVPTDEPSCVPSRPTSVAGSTVYSGAVTGTDGDGDGVLDGVDACPDVFDPVRPMDGGAQADSDADGVGDACDRCPFDADVTDCTTP